MTIQGFGSQLLDLPTIFSGNLFSIPDYQRGYAWEKKQVEELLKDVEHLISDGKALRHYTGTLVLSRPQDMSEGEFHIVDGQQRLTTLVILLHQLCMRLPADQQTVFEELYLRRGDIGNEHTVLRLNSDTRLFFERVVLVDGNTEFCPISLEAHQRLLEAGNLIGKWLDEQLDSGIELEMIKQTLEKRLGFLVYAPKEDAETGIMFEVINNRGKPLSELEKVKNYLIYCCVKLSANTLRESIDHDWSDILKALNVAKKTSSGEEGAFLRYCLVVHFKRNKTDSQYGYDELKKLFSLDRSLASTESRAQAIQRISGFVAFLKTAARWYQRLYGPDHYDLEPRIVEVLDQIRAQGRHASIMPLFLAMVIKLNGKGERLLKLLRLLEVLNFRVYMARNMTTRNDTGQGGLYWYAARYYHGGLLNEIAPDDRKIGRELIESEDDALELLLVRFVHDFATEGRFKASFSLDVESPDDFYKWGGVRYFLMNYEAKLQPKKTIQIDKILLGVQDKKTADYLSIEHLWATENRSGEGENNRKQDKFQRRRLGNFVLLELRLNIQGCNDDLENKLPRYLKGINDEPPTDLQQVRRMARDAEAILKTREEKNRRINFYHDLHAELNDLQEQRYIDFAVSRWSLKSFLGYKKILKEYEEQIAEVG